MNRVLHGMKESPVLFGSFIVLSVLAALTEGIGVSLLIPILDSQSMGNSFSNVPVLSYVSQYFDGIYGSEKLTLAAVFLLAVIIFRGVLQMAVLTVSIMIPLKVQRRLTMIGYKSMLSVGMGYINSHDIGDHLNNIKERPTRISALLKTSADAMSLFLIFVTYTCMMLLISWELTIVAVLVLGFYSWCLKFFNEGPIAVLGKRTSGALADFNQISI
jgi:ABC-type multidrug transport system fused ATPase/permease subunit